jgi:hypothetical protein
MPPIPFRRFTRLLSGRKRSEVAVLARAVEEQDHAHSSRHQVFRLETLDFYDSKSERVPLERFRAGLPQDPSWLGPWADRVRAINRRGASIGRVHVVSEPLTEYVTFEMTCAYPSNIDAGEEIGVLPRPAAEKLGVPDGDYWLFDDERVERMVYDDDGALMHVDVTSDPLVSGSHSPVALSRYQGHFPPGCCRTRTDPGLVAPRTPTPRPLRVPGRAGLGDLGLEGADCGQGLHPRA